MSGNSDDSPFFNWIKRLTGAAIEPAARRSISSEEATELLRKAARCYALADMPDDACRTLETLGEYQQSAQYHERQGRHEQAAAAYERAADWLAAARCYSACGRPDRAGDCLQRGGARIEAAWVWAHQARQFQRARAAVQRASPQSDVDRLEIEMVLARSETGTGSRTEGARRLRRAVQEFHTLPPAAIRHRLHEWALAVAGSLERPDLIATVRAAGVQVGLQSSEEEWGRRAAQASRTRGRTARLDNELGEPPE